eukprot:5364037-Prymnesium_polylepis.1
MTQFGDNTGRTCACHRCMRSGKKWMPHFFVHLYLVRLYVLSHVRGSTFTFAEMRDTVQPETIRLYQITCHGRVSVLHHFEKYFPLEAVNAADRPLGRRVMYDALNLVQQIGCVKQKAHDSA